MKLKLFILLALFTAFSFTTKAQSLTFDQTVDYINEIVKSQLPTYYRPNGDYMVGMSFVKVDKSGRITFGNFSTDNKFQACSSWSVFDLVSSQWSDYQLSFQNKDKVVLGKIGPLSSYEDANRLFKAIMHLKNVCTKSADPFGN